MSYTREVAIRMVEENIRLYRASLDLLTLVPQFEKARYYIDAGSVHVHLPFDWDIYKEYRKALGDQWKHVDDWTTTQHSGAFVSHHTNFLHISDPADKYFMTKRAYLSVGLHTNLPGSTCKLVQTGTKEVPILSVECS